MTNCRICDEQLGACNRCGLARCENPICLDCIEGAGFIAQMESKWKT